MVPSFLYCFYNNLSFTNLISFDPTTYFMFMQARLLVTGIIYQVSFDTLNYWPNQHFGNNTCFVLKSGIIQKYLFQFVFKRYLSTKQWLSLLILTIGCVIQKMDIPNVQNSPLKGIENTLKEKIPAEENYPLSTSNAYFSFGTGISLIFVQVNFQLQHSQ